MAMLIDKATSDIEIILCDLRWMCVQSLSNVWRKVDLNYNALRDECDDGNDRDENVAISKDDMIDTSNTFDKWLNVKDIGDEMEMAEFPINGFLLFVSKS